MKENTLKKSEKRKALIVLSLIGVAILGYLGMDYYRNSQSIDLLNRLNHPAYASSIPCYGVGSTQNLPDISTLIPPTPTLSPMMMSTVQAVKDEKKASIEATVVFQQTAPESAGVFSEFGEEYIESVVRVDLQTSTMNNVNYLGTGLVIGLESTGKDKYGLDQYLVFVLTHNHPDKNDNYKKAIERGEEPKLIFYGVGINKTAIPIGSGNQVGCTKIIAEKEYVANIIAIKTNNPANFNPYPLEKIHGPCLNENGTNSLQMISFPVSGNKTDGQPLGSNINPPYWAIAVKDERGTSRELITGYGLNNLGSSGALVKIPGGNVCGINNYAFSTRADLIGFDPFSDEQSMLTISKEFFGEQVKKIQVEK